MFPIWCLGAPLLVFGTLHQMYYGANFSHYQQKNYYHTQPYTKEFIHKYHRLERWRFY